MKQQFSQMWQQLKTSPGADSLLVQWGLLIALLLAAQMWLIEPYFTWREETQDLMQTQTRKISSLIHLQKSIKQWEKALQQADNYLQTSAQAFIAAPSYAVAQQQMYNFVQAAVTQHQVKVDSQRLLDLKATTVGEQIGLQLTISGKLIDLINFVDSISHAPQIFTIEQLSIAQNQTDALMNVTLSTYRLQKMNAELTTPTANPQGTAAEEETPFEVK